MLGEVASEPGFTGWVEAWVSWRNIKGKGSGKCEDAGVGPQTHPARTGAPSEALQRVRPRSPSLVSSWETEAQRGGGLTCHCPSSRESCGPCSLGALAPPSRYSLVLPEMLGGCGVATWGLRQDSGGAQARPHPEGGSCIGCLWLGPGSPTRGLPLPLWAGTAATVGPTP